MDKVLYETPFGCIMPERWSRDGNPEGFLYNWYQNGKGQAAGLSVHSHISKAKRALDMVTVMKTRLTQVR